MSTVVLMGGNEFRQNCIPMDRELLKRIPRQRPRVAIMPTAAQDAPDLAARNGVRYFTGLGAAASAVMVIDRAGANDPLYVAQLEGADMVYLVGGNPWHLLESLRDSQMWAAIKVCWQAGCILAGSSAGAMVLGGKMRTRSQSWVDALGLVSEIAVMPHYRRSEDAAIKEWRDSLPPEYVVLGIPEATACVSSGDEGNWSVVSADDVAVVSAGRIRHFAPGQRFDLK